MRTILITVTMLVLASHSGHAQQWSDGGQRSRPPSDTTAEIGTVGNAVAAATGLGMAGFFIGGIVGLANQEQVRPMDPAFIGASLGIAIGAHLGNGMQGYFLADLAVPLCASMLTIAITDHNGPWFLVEAPLQVAATVAIERAGARSRARRHPLRLSIAPDGRGRVTVGARISF